MKHERIRPAPVEGQLARALIGAAHNAGIELAIGDHRSRPWASATFVGAQHDLTVSAPHSEAMAAWLAALPEAELAPRGHLVASLAVDRIVDDGARVAATLAVLTLEDG